MLAAYRTPVVAAPTCFPATSKATLPNFSSAETEAPRINSKVRNDFPVGPFIHRRDVGTQVPSKDICCNDIILRRRKRFANILILPCRHGSPVLGDLKLLVGHMRPAPDPMGRIFFCCLLLRWRRSPHGYRNTLTNRARIYGVYLPAPGSYDVEPIVSLLN